ncbi:hypothetical protein LEMLEM_LOCUS20625, partial [Lemmus lemmus]
MRKWRAWSLPLSPLEWLLLKLFREAHLGGSLSPSSKDDAEFMTTEQVAFSRASTEDSTSNTQLLPPIFYHR